VNPPSNASAPPVTPDYVKLINTSGLAHHGFSGLLYPAVKRPLAQFFPFFTEKKHHWSKPQISHDHIQRVTVGLRPHRASGFVVKSEQVGSKTLIHNYGHGGSGWSLCWGTAFLVSEELKKTTATKVAVLGSGINGLATARLLQRYGYEVVIYTKDIPPNVISNRASAGWSPTATLCDEGKYTPEFKKLLTSTARISHRFWQDFVGIERYGVEYRYNYAGDDLPFGAPSPDDIGSDIMDLNGEAIDVAEADSPFKFAHVHKTWTLRFQVPVFMQAMQDDFRIAGGKVVIKEFTKLEQIDALPESAVVNCMGLGTKQVFDDPELMPIRGQLTHLVPQANLDYSFSWRTKLVNFNPRRDALTCGGSTLPNIWSMEPDKTEVDRVMDGLMEMVKTRFAS
jgi:D-amino-acid oxidase